MLQECENSISRTSSCDPIGASLTFSLSLVDAEKTAALTALRLTTDKCDAYKTRVEALVHDIEQARLDAAAFALAAQSRESELRYDCSSDEFSILLFSAAFSINSVSQTATHYLVSKLLKIYCEHLFFTPNHSLYVYPPHSAAPRTPTEASVIAPCPRPTRCAKP